jgi:hypothetical protein
MKGIESQKKEKKQPISLFIHSQLRSLRLSVMTK